MRHRRVLIFAIFAVALITANAGVAAAEPPAPPDMPGASLWVPWSDFKAILDQLGQVAPPPVDPPPREALLGNAEVVAVVGENAVIVSATFKVTVLKPTGWAVLPVLPSSAPLVGAQLDGKPTALTEVDGSRAAVISGPGEHTLVVTMQLPLDTEGGAPRYFNLPLPSAAVGRLEVRLPRANQAVTVNGAALLNRNVGATTVATGALPRGGSAMVRWARQAERAAKADARVSAEVRTMLTLGEGQGVYTTIADFDIQHKGVEQFVFLLPADLAVADVSTDGLADWRVEKTDDGQRLIVDIAFQAIGRHTVAATFEQPLPSGDQATVDVADIAAAGVVHELGYLAVAVRTNVQVTPTEGSLKKLAALDPSELPSDLRGAGDQQVLYGYKYLGHPYAAALEITKHKDASVLICKIEKADYRIMLTDDGKELIEGTYRIANRSLQYLTLTLPEGADLWGVFRDGQPVKAAERDGKILLPIFQGGLRETFTLKILAYRHASGFLPVGRFNLKLPELDVSAGEVRLELYLPERFRYHDFDGSLRPTGAASLITGDAMDDRDETISYERKDTGKLDNNARYRFDQSQVQQQVVDLPISSSNVGYGNTLARGGLPVQFQVQWDGGARSFKTTLVDPGERPNVSFWFIRRLRSPLLALVFVLGWLLIGVVVSAEFAARRTTLIPRPNRRHGLLVLAAIPLGSLAGLFVGFGVAETLPVLFLGAAGVVGLWAYRHTKLERSIPRAEPVVPQPPEGGDQ
jgi:hypothetical protein